MKLFLDTNVLASAAATRGLCADVVREALASHELIVSDQVLRELRRVLRSKFRVDKDLVDEFISLLEQETTFAHPSRLPGIQLEDRDDVAILGAALAGGADVLVTGDKELLVLKRIDRMEILSPRGFWEKLQSQHKRRRGK
jgi:putative PIN family toxin of toxin-antitoxin system